MTPEYVFGATHPAYVPPSSLHSKVELGSFDANTNAGAVLLVGSAGRVVIAVLGGVRSTIHKWEAGDESALPTSSTAT